MNPYVHVSDRKERVWSEWIESCRKDVECVFGNLKKRFRFLKNAIEFHCQHQIDNALFTCCIIHNMILMYDGLDSRWEDDVDWDLLDPLDNVTGETDTVNRAAILLSRVNACTSHLLSNRVIEGNETYREVDTNHESIRRALVIHFDHRLNRKSVAWPKGFTDKQRKEFRLS